MQPQPRELTDDYRLERILASSRGASILAATALASGSAVVVKLVNVPPAASPARAAAVAARFTAAAGALAGLRHPNLPRVLDAGMTPDGGAFLVMERLEGVGFDAHAAQAGGAPEIVLPLLMQALGGLEELARHGLAHLGVAPENLFVAASPATPATPATAAGDAPVVKLLGLGTPLFHLGEAWGDNESSRFRAPELSLPAAAAAAFADWHADSYSLALTACNALGATVAFGEAPGPVVQMPLALSFELANDEALRQILERCLRRVPTQRPAAAEIRAAFGLALGMPPAAAPGPEQAPLAPRTAPRPEQAPLAPRPEQAPPEHVVAPLLAPPPEWAAPPGQPQAPQAPPRPSADLSSFATGAPLPPAAASEGWRSALTAQAPPPQAPSWRSTGSVTPLDAPIAPIAEPPPAAAAVGRTGEKKPFLANDSSLDLLAVPDILPDLPAGDLGGHDVPAGDTVAPSASEMAAALGIDLAAGGPGQGGYTDGAALPFGASIGADATPRAVRTGTTPAAAPAAGPAPAAGAAVFAPSAAAAVAAPAAPPPGMPDLAMPAGFAPAATAGTATASLGTPAFAPPPIASAPAAAPQGGEMLSAVDELLSSLPPPPPMQGTPPAQRPGRTSGAMAAVVQAAPGAMIGGGGGGVGVGGGGGAGAGRAGAAVAAPRPSPLAALRGLPRPLLLGGAGFAALVVVAAAGFLFLRHRAQAGAPSASAEAAAPAAPAEVPGRSAAAKFFDAKSYLILGRDSDGRVRQALHELSFGEQGELGEEGCRELRSIEQTLALAELETAPQDLSSGLRNGDLGLLEAVTGAASERDVPAGQRGELERARALVKLYEEAQSAAASGDQAAVLDRFHIMEGLSRTLHDPLSLRDNAAAALEAEAAALAQEGRYDQAIGRLEPLRRGWPERAGVKDLLKTYETAAANETSQQAILDQVPTYLRRRKPSEGLDLLRGVTPTPHLAARIQDAIQQLDAQLAQLDAQPPQVALRDDYPLDYSRGQVVTLSFRVTDDYEVKTVKMFARPPGGAMHEMQLQRSGLAYTIEIPPSFHQNGTVDFYVVATDLSGHEGTLGTRDKPMQLKRRQGFERLLR